MMKKWLAGVLAAAICLVGAVAAAECEHENTSSHIWKAFKRYEQTNSAEEHILIYDEYRETTCRDCEDYCLTELLSEGNRETETHSFTGDGFCRWCGYGNDCQHPYGERREDWSYIRYTSVGNNMQHLCTGGKYSYMICYTCWQMYDYEIIDRDAQEYENHVWDNKACSYCGQENTCTHDGETESRTETENYRYESTGDLQYHELKWDVYEVIDCVECGVQKSRTFVKSESNRNSHSWGDDNVCRYCKQTNACTHEDINEYTNTSEDRYTEIDADTHLHTFTLIIQKDCGVCNQRLKTEEGGYYEVVEPHKHYGSESCRNCGYVCEHTNTRERKRHNRTYTDLGDGLHHSVVDEIQYYTYCDDCDRKISDYIRTETKEYTEEHGGKYYCQDCGFEAECPHENGSYERTDWLDTRHVQVDEKNHEVYGRTVVYAYCNDCDECLSETESETEELLTTEPHYWNSQNICRYCGYENPNPCMHENTEIMLKQTYSSGWMSQNDAMHAETVIYKEVSVCSDCGKTQGEIASLKKVTKTEEHHFEFGVCRTCDYQNPCEHNGSTHTETETWGWIGNPISIDDKTHKINAEVATITYCDLCDDRIKEEVADFQWITEEHRMWGDHCEWCDYKIACEHENATKKVLPSSDYLFCESISDNAHAATYILYSTAYCADCDKLLEFENESDEVGMTKVNEPHNMVNHRCVECGYCEHPEDKIKSKSKYLGSKTVRYNEYMHMGVETYAIMDICQQCGVTVREYVRTNYSSGGLTSWHNYDDNGICNDCGYVNTCKHENAYRLPPEHNTTRHEDLGDGKQHKVMRWASSSMFCPDCRDKWDYQQETEPDVFVEDHYYTWDKYGELRDECSRCGYVSNNSQICTHENTGIHIEYGDYGVLVEYVDEQYHNEYCKDKYKVITCTVCGIELSREMIQEGLVLVSKDEHYEAKTCECGYVNPCKHENTVIGIVGSFEKYVLQIDDTHHEIVQVLQKGLRCTYCNEYLTELDEFEEERIYAKHVFNKYGRCTDCNYVNHCEHIQTQINYDYSVYSCYVVSDEEHEIRHRIQEREECLSCGALVRTEYVEDVAERQNHVGEGYCQVCGYGDSHVHSWEVSLEDRIVYSAKAVDELTHEAEIQRGRFRYCVECDSYSSGKPLPIEKVVEPHNFTDLGRCADCGYVNFCAHEETYEVQKPVFEPTYQMKDDVEHTYTASMRIETRCATCDQRLSYTAKLNAECTEEHAFDSVADLICDLCGYEKEPPEEAPTPEPTPTEEPTPEPTDTPAPTKKPDSGSTGGGGSSSSGGTKPSKPKETATPTPEEALPRTGDASLPIGVLLIAAAISLCGLGMMAKKKRR